MINKILHVQVCRNIQYHAYIYTQCYLIPSSWQLAQLKLVHQNAHNVYNGTFKSFSLILSNAGFHSFQLSYLLEKKDSSHFWVSESNNRSTKHFTYIYMYLLEEAMILQFLKNICPSPQETHCISSDHNYRRQQTLTLHWTNWKHF